MIATSVEQVFLSNMGFVVLLKGKTDERVLPIFIGAAEAQAIALKLKKVEVPRPMTHDLLKNVMDFLECRLKRVEICDLRDGTFYARLIVDRSGGEVEIDSRPSDAIALALRFEAPIYVDDDVMNEAGRTDLTGHADSRRKAKTCQASGGEKKDDSLLATLKQDLEKAIKDERYEDAARLRDEIKRFEQTHSEN